MMKVKEGQFEFQRDDDGWLVFYRRKTIGQIVAKKETSGRHCFRLGCDARRSPRTYRGKVKAAEALLSLHKLTKEAAKKKWSTEMLILNAWDTRPTVAQTQ